MMVVVALHMVVVTKVEIIVEVVKIEVWIYSKLIIIVYIDLYEYIIQSTVLVLFVIICLFVLYCLC